MVTQELREFLNDHKDLIKLQKYDELYSLFFDDFGSNIDDELIEFNNIFACAGIDVVKYLSPESWYAAGTIIQEDVFCDPKFAPAIFGSIYDEASNTITIKLPYSDLAEYLSDSDFPENTIEDFLANDISGDWDSNYEISTEDEIYALENTALIEPIKNKLKELGIISDNRIGKQTVNEEAYKANETVMEAVSNATFQSTDAGSQNAALNDFNKALDSAMPKYMDNYEDDGSNIVLKINLTKLKPEISRLIDDDVNNYFNYPDELVDDIQKGISLDIGDNFKFREPYDGWMDNDDAVFNDILADYLL